MPRPRARTPAAPVGLPTIAAIATLTAIASCGPASRRDLSRVPQRQISFDDRCGLQGYFDQRNASRAQPFRTLEETQATSVMSLPDESGEVQTRQVVTGEGLYLLTDRPARRRLQQLLSEEFTNVPDLGLSRPEARVQVRAQWWVSGSIRRLLPDQPLEVTGPVGTLTLPFNPCVGELLFGAEVYAMRRRFLDDANARSSGREAPSVLRALATPQPDAPPPDASQPDAPPPDASQSSNAE
jgi:hypothetical protein